MKKVVVLGASPNRYRYSFSAVQRLASKGYEVVPVGNKPEMTGNHEIVLQMPEGGDVDTVSVYLRPELQELYIDQILDMRPRRIIFNPGAENPVLAAMASERGIEVENACTLVLLNTGQF